MTAWGDECSRQRLDAARQLIETQRMTDGQRQSDRAAWLLIIALLVLSCLIEVRSSHMEFIRDGIERPDWFAKEWLYEITSHVAMAIAALMVPLWLNRFPVSVSNIYRRLPIYGLGFALFTIAHIGLMVAMRSALWPGLFEGHYEFGITRAEPWLYEIQKDVFSFILIVSTFITARHMNVLREEVRAARTDAKQTGQLSLKSGGRVIVLPAAEVVYATSAGNYVDLHTQTGSHFVRLTLTELQTLLDEAGAQPIRLHRSHLTTRASLREIGPAGALLKTGTRLPVGRKYRAALQG